MIDDNKKTNRETQIVNNDGQVFVVKILHQQNNTWQGTINWVNNKEEKSFRSALELIRLMDSAMTKES